MVYKTVQVIWCCSSMIIVVLGFPCLYFALYVGVRQSRFALLLPLALSKRLKDWKREIRRPEGLIVHQEECHGVVFRIVIASKTLKEGRECGIFVVSDADMSPTVVLVKDGTDLAECACSDHMGDQFVLGSLDVDFK